MSNLSKAIKALNKPFTQAQYFELLEKFDKFKEKHNNVVAGYKGQITQLQNQINQLKKSK